MIEIREMWQAGPLRQWSEDRFLRAIPYAKGGYVGRYVCKTCKKRVFGVYEPQWLCSACRTEIYGVEVANQGIPEECHAVN